MADFSPTGYWAIYADGDDIVSFPVAAFRNDFGDKAYAWICHEEGYLVRADTYDGAGTFLGIETAGDR